MRIPVRDPEHLQFALYLAAYASLNPSAAIIFIPVIIALVPAESEMLLLMFYSTLFLIIGLPGLLKLLDRFPMGLFDVCLCSTRFHGLDRLIR